MSVLHVCETTPVPTLERCSSLSSELLAVVDPAGLLVEVNEAWTTLLGWSRGELLYRSLAELVHPRDRRSTAQATAAPVERRAEFVNRLRARSGGYRFFEWAAVRDESGFLHAAAHDVSLEREARATAAELARLALHDGLTGLLNHRAFHGRLAEEVERARRYGAPLCLALVDFDHFKRINDAHGHQVGDAVLAGGSQLLRETARTTDPLGRVGGEEIAWLLPETTLAPATVACDRARHAVAAARWGGGVRTTVSVGAVELHGDETELELYRRADEALYAAKASGRDRVVARG